MKTTHISRKSIHKRLVPAIVAIDGCSEGCAKAILGHAEIPIKNYVLITELGIEKNKDFNLKNEDIQKVKDAVRRTYINETVPPICC